MTVQRVLGVGSGAIVFKYGPFKVLKESWKMEHLKGLGSGEARLQRQKQQVETLEMSLSGGFLLGLWCQSALSPFSLF